MQASSRFRSDLAAFYKFKYDMGIDHWRRGEWRRAKTVFVELTQDALTPLIWKAMSYYMLAGFKPLSRGVMYLEDARSLGALLQDEAARVLCLDLIEARQAQLDAVKAAREAEPATDASPAPA